MLYIERIADIVDILMAEVEKGINASETGTQIIGKISRDASFSTIDKGMSRSCKSTNYNAKYNHNSNKMKRNTMQKQSSSRNERKSILKSNRSELVDLKRKTLELMNKLLDKEIRKEDTNHGKKDPSELVTFIQNNIPLDEELDEPKDSFFTTEKVD